MIDYSVFDRHHAGPGKVDFARVPCGSDAWSGAIYREDRRLAVDTIRCLIENGHYPKKTMGMNREQKVGAAMRHFAIEGTSFGAEP